MIRCRTTRRVRLELFPLEGRRLLSADNVTALHATAAAEHNHFSLTGATTNPAGVAAILSALNGGTGHEFVTLVRREVHNLNAVIAGFTSGQLTQYTIPGLVAKVPNLQEQYTGPPYDRMALTEAGAILLKGNVIELGAITRGPFANSPPTTNVVFGLNRGAGASLGPGFASRPGITPDALVTVTVGPFGQTASATLTDLTTGATQALPSSAVLVQGPTLRVFVQASQLPSKGFALKNYHFAAWTQLTGSDGIASVGSFAPESAMIPIGVETNVRPPSF